MVNRAVGPQLVVRYYWLRRGISDEAGSVREGANLTELVVEGEGRAPRDNRCVGPCNFLDLRSPSRVAVYAGGGCCGTRSYRTRFAKRARRVKDHDQR